MSLALQKTATVDGIGWEHNAFVLLIRARYAMRDSKYPRSTVERFNIAAGQADVLRYSTQTTPLHVLQRVIDTIREYCELKVKT